MNGSKEETTEQNADGKIVILK